MKFENDSLKQEFSNQRNDIQDYIELKMKEMQQRDRKMKKKQFAKPKVPDIDLKKIFPDFIDALKAEETENVQMKVKFWNKI